MPRSMLVRGLFRIVGVVVGLIVGGFVDCLREGNLLFRNVVLNDGVERRDLCDVIRLLIVHVKKIDNNRRHKEPKKNGNNEELINSKEKSCIYDLYFEPLIKLIKLDCKTETPLYRAIIKKYLIDNKMNSMMNFLEPLFQKNDVIINKGLDRYIKTQTFAEFLAANNVIPQSENFLLPYENDVLLDINIIVKEIDQSDPLLDCFEENKENIINDIINNMSDN